MNLDLQDIRSTDNLRLSRIYDVETPRENDLRARGQTTLVPSSPQRNTLCRSSFHGQHIAISVVREPERPRLHDCILSA